LACGNSVNIYPPLAISSDLCETQDDVYDTVGAAVNHGNTDG